MSTEYSAENQNQYHQTVKQWSTLLDSVLLQHPVKMTLKVVAVFSAICSLQIKKMAIHKKKKHVVTKEYRGLGVRGGDKF